MKYMLLIHQGTTPTPRGPEAWATLSEDEQKAVFADYQAINETAGVTPGFGLDPSGSSGNAEGRRAAWMPRRAGKPTPLRGAPDPIAWLECAPRSSGPGAGRHPSSPGCYYPEERNYEIQLPYESSVPVTS